MNIVLTPTVKSRLDMLYIPERASTKATVAALQAEVARTMVKRLVGPRLSLARRVEFYEHGVDWTDRLIVGDSRIVMDSVLACELMAGKVEMIYVDLPSSDATNDDPTDEAASSLAYLRDRLSLCRDLLHESGGIFVRLSGASLPGVRSVMDKIFGADNCCGIVTLEQDCLVWYSRDLSRVKYQQLLRLLDFHAQYPSVFGEGSERRRRCGILLR